MRAEGPLLTVANGFNTLRAHALRDKPVLQRVRPAITQRKIVFLRSAITAVSFDQHPQAGVLHQEITVILSRRILVRAQVGRVEVKENILHAFSEELLVAGRNRARNRCGIHSHVGGGLPRSAGSRRNQRVDS